MKPDIPRRAAVLVELCKDFDAEALLAVGEEYQREWPSRDTVEAIGAWMKLAGSDWYLPLHAESTQLVRARFPGEWPEDGAQKYIAAAIDAAAIAVCMLADGSIERSAYQDACRGFHAAYRGGWS